MKYNEIRRILKQLKKLKITPYFVLPTFGDRTHYNSLSYKLVEVLSPPIAVFVSLCPPIKPNKDTPFWARFGHFENK